LKKEEKEIKYLSAHLKCGVVKKIVLGTFFRDLTQCVAPPMVPLELCLTLLTSGHFTPWKRKGV
jgi:hypothetical protein